MILVVLRNEFAKFSHQLECERLHISQVESGVKNILNKLLDENKPINVDTLRGELLYTGNYSTYVSRSIDLDKYDYIVACTFKEDKVWVRSYYYDGDSGREIDNYVFTFVYKKPVEGNCVDDFLERGVKHLVDSINAYVKDIESRKDERVSATEYRNSICYELDFNRVCMIKMLAEKIAKNCSTHLEKISENYS